MYDPLSISSSDFRRAKTCIWARPRTLCKAYRKEINPAANIIGYTYRWIDKPSRLPQPFRPFEFHELVNTLTCTPNHLILLGCAFLVRDREICRDTPFRQSWQTGCQVGWRRRGRRRCRSRKTPHTVSIHPFGDSFWYDRRMKDRLSCPD